MKVNKAWLEDCVDGSRFMLLSMAYKDAVVDGTDGEFMQALAVVLKERAGWRRRQAAWRTFIDETMPKLKESALALAGQSEKLRRDMVAEQRKLNASKGKRTTSRKKK